MRVRRAAQRHRARSRVKLHSLRNGEPSAAMCAEVQLVATLPQSARDSLWTLLEPHLGPQIPDTAQVIVSAFCAEHGVTEDDLAPVVRACRDLFRAAAGLDLGVEEMAADLSKLLPGDQATVRILIGCYVKALPRVRSLNVVALLGEYGSVLDDVSVRMDYVHTTRHDPTSMVPIAMMSLRYRADDEPQHLAVQLPLPLLAKLKAMCDAILGQASS